MKHTLYLLFAICLFSSCAKSIYRSSSPDYSPIVQISTSFGDMEVQLFANTPKHRDNFVKLVKQGFYDSLLFHRVIDKFMIQGGDPKSKNANADQMLGSSGPGYTIPAEFIDSNIHIKGALAAARMGDQVNPKKESSGSQFYLVMGQPVSDKLLNMMMQRNGVSYTDAQKELYRTIGGTPHLDGGYTVFGRVIKGIEIIDKIAKVSTNSANRPKTDVIMKMKLLKG